jgi:adenine-specific DNA-methyltransferase
MFSRTWKDGKPTSSEGYSHVFKYLRLESYEDALANIRLRRSESQQTLLDGSDSFEESYLLGYMLDAEAKGSASLLDLDRFEDPFSYELLVGTGSVGETKPVKVDLVETFNWLLGLHVHHTDHIRGFRVVEGTNPRCEKILVIWRNLKETSNEDLDEFFKKQQYNTLDMEFDLVYVNGDNNLMNLPMAPEGGEPPYKVRLIEEEFQRLMFDVKDVE